MRRLQCALLAAVAVIGFASIASAADIPTKAPVYKAPIAAPVYNWTGCYVGGNLGGAWARRNADESTIPIGFNAGPGSVTLGGSALIGGVHAGCNYQFSGNWVVGIEGDWSGTRLNDTQTAPNILLNGIPAAAGNIAFSQSVKSLASIRGRLGTAAIQPNVLLYVTGGGAWARTNLDGLHSYVTLCPNCSQTSITSSRAGWTAGAGIEWAPWSNNWIVRTEYLYYRFAGDNSLGIQQATGATTTNWNWGALQIHEVRAGLSYKFN